MGLELNFSNQIKQEENKADIWQNFDSELLKKFCLVNDLGSVTAFKINFDYFINFKPVEAKKLLKLFVAFYSSESSIKNERVGFDLDEMNKKIDENKQIKEDETNKINLNFFKVQMNKKHKYEIILKKSQSDMSR